MAVCFFNVHVVHLCNGIDTAAAWKKSRFILSDRSDFHMIGCLSIAVHTFARHISTSLSDDKTLLPSYVNFSTNFRGPPFGVEMVLSWLKYVYSVLSPFTWRPMIPAAALGYDFSLNLFKTLKCHHREKLKWFLLYNKLCLYLSFSS